MLIERTTSLGEIKDELKGISMIKIIGLRSQMYTRSRVWLRMGDNSSLRITSIDCSIKGAVETYETIKK